ncbi:MAG: hypothetical protein WDM70_09095 [Nitrosomonadales bacterium]
MRRLVIFILLFFSATTQADGLGRLFFTPQQRVQLEANFARNANADGNHASSIMVNGIVQQNGGVRTVWINGVPQHSAHAEGAATEKVTVPGKSSSIKIKVGESFLLDQALPQIAPAPAE